MSLFKKASKNILKIDTLIGVEAEITGQVKGSGNYKIDGSIIGDVTVNGDVVVTRDGAVKGNIYAKNIMVEGKVEGDITAEIELVVKDTAVVNGVRHEAGVLTVDEGSKFTGDCKITGNTIDKRFFEPKSE